MSRTNNIDHAIESTITISNNLVELSMLENKNKKLVKYLKNALKYVPEDDLFYLNEERDFIVNQETSCTFSTFSG